MDLEWDALVVSWSMGEWATCGLRRILFNEYKFVERYGYVLV